MEKFYYGINCTDKNIYYGIVTFVITFTLSKISYHVFERYFIKIGQKN